MIAAGGAMLASLLAGGAEAQPAGTAPAPSPTDIIVHGPDRPICRAVRRTATRMRTAPAAGRRRSGRHPRLRSRANIERLRMRRTSWA